MPAGTPTTSFASGELVATRHYELTKETEMLVIIFCFQIDKNLIDKNQKLSALNSFEKLEIVIRFKQIQISGRKVNGLLIWRGNFEKAG